MNRGVRLVNVVVLPAWNGNRRWLQGENSMSRRVRRCLIKFGSDN